MSAPKRSASEVIRDTEMILQRVVAERERAAALLKYSNTLQQEAYDLAISALGDVVGTNAYDLACTVLQVDPSERTGDNSGGHNNASSEWVVTPEKEDFGPKTTSLSETAEEVVKPVNSVSKPSSIVKKSPSKSTDVKAAVDGSKLIFYGVEVKRAKKIEAESLIEKAKNAVSQNKKSNPYESDRGRNSWRNHLFQAVLSAESLESSNEEADEDLTDDADNFGATSEEDIAVVDTSDSNNQSDTSSDLEIDATEPPAIAPDPFDDPVVKPPSNPRSTPFARSPVRFTPVTTSPPPKDEVVTGETIEDTSDDVSEDEKIDIHTVKAVEGRVPAHGQSSPMPEGLAEEIRKRSSPITSSPVAPSRPVIAKPSFLNKTSK